MSASSAYQQPYSNTLVGASNLASQKELATEGNKGQEALLMAAFNTAAARSNAVLQGELAMPNIMPPAMPYGQQRASATTGSRRHLQGFRLGRLIRSLRLNRVGLSGLVVALGTGFLLMALLAIVNTTLESWMNDMAQKTRLMSDDIQSLEVILNRIQSFDNVQHVVGRVQGIAPPSGVVQLEAYVQQHYIPCEDTLYKTVAKPSSYLPVAEL